MFYNYVNTTYPTISRILINMFRSNKSTAYDHIIAEAKLKSKEQIESQVPPDYIRDHMRYTQSELASAKLNNITLVQPKQVLYLNSDEIKNLRDKTLKAYKSHICFVEGKLEKALFDYMLTEPATINYDDIPRVISDEEIKLIEKFEFNVRKFIVFQQYYTRYLMKRVYL